MLSKTQRRILLIGTIQTILTAVYHFYLPFQYQWSRFVPEEAPTIAWSMFALNNYFSFNLLTVSLILLYFLLRHQVKITTIQTLSFVLLLFWLFSTVYQILAPMPLPTRLGWLSYILLGVAIVNSGLFIYAILNMKKDLRPA